MTKLIIYAISILMCTFSVSGINFDGFIKKNHIWEARFLSIIFILCLSYILANFLYDIMNISIIQNTRAM